MTFGREPAQIAELDALLRQPGLKAAEAVDVDEMNRRSMQQLMGQGGHGMIRAPRRPRK